MTFFASFALSFGALLALMALVSAWLFRASGAPLAVKLAVPAIMVALACGAPYAVASMMGFPVAAALAQLPEKAELVAFVPHDEARLVDLWLRIGDAPPRAYETELTDGLKQTLEEAKAVRAAGRRAALEKRAVKRAGVIVIPAADAPYELDDGAFALPKKG